VDQKLLNILDQLLLVHCATYEAEIRVNCNEDVSLDCHGVNFTNMNFISVAWYKLNNNRQRGIIRKNKDIKEPERYFFHRPTDVGENNNLILRNVTSKDSGIYECGVSASVGSKNANSKISLYVSDCVTKPVPTTMTNILNTTLQCSHRVEDLPVVWSVTGYLAVGVAKIVLSLFIIWVNNILLHIRPHVGSRPQG
uniref:Si:dkey-109a10.2 n=1 Tax=Sphaeramia orbicularis TaxID=375764 RepID=A0A672YHY9_9TELE